MSTKVISYQKEKATLSHIYASKRYASMRVYSRNYRTFSYINQHFSFSSVNKRNVTYSV